MNTQSGFGINEKKRFRGSVYYGRDVLLRAGLKLEENSNVLLESSVVFDMGVKTSPKFQHFVKLDAKSATTSLELGTKEEKFVNFDGILSG